MDYLTLINKYGANLDKHEKPIARRLFNDLLTKGWNYEQIYWGVRLLKGRSIEQYRGLFYYKDYIEEIQEKIVEIQEITNLNYKDKILALSDLYCFGWESVPDQYKDQLADLMEKVDDESDRYRLEDLEDEVNYIYEKCYLEPMIEFSVEDIYKKEILNRKYLYSGGDIFA